MSRSWYVLMVLVALLLASALVVATQSRSVNNGPTTFTTVAGNGKMGYSGDGGQATQASLRLPGAVAVGADRSLYIADTGSHRIRKVSPRGVITTVAGDGWRDGALLGRYAGDGGPATQASLDCPRGVAVGNDGSLYIADKHNHCIRKVTHDGVISTVAGTGRARYSGDGGQARKACLSFPQCVAVSADGSLLIADTHNFRIRKVDPTGFITTVVGSEVTDKAGLDWPGNVALGPDGSLYIADAQRCQVRKVAAAAGGHR